MTERLCVVAGAGPGMGLAIAERFALEGYALALLARSERQIAGYASDLEEKYGIRAAAWPVDLSDPDAIAQVFGKVRAELGDPEVLVYNAAGWRAAPALDIAPADFARDLSLSVVGALACAQQVAAAMQADRGSMLFTGGGLALYPQYGKGVASLAAGKSALRALVYALAGELAPGVHVATVTIGGSVAPGTAFDPGRIAEAYWALHAQPPQAWETERVFDGQPG
jgi:NAD(P)-dependent dehydrogenase (short-subunit alcohol dehydrogenase family)